MAGLADELPPWLDGGQEHAAPPPPPAPVRRWRPKARLLLFAAGLAATVVATVLAVHGGSRGSRPGPAPLAGGLPATAAAPPAQGALPAARWNPADPPPAWPGVLPAPLLVADQGDGRLVEVSPAGHPLWQYPAQGATEAATSVTFSPEGDAVIAVGEQAGVVAQIGFYSGKAAWAYGGSGQLQAPNSAALLPSGNVIVADTRACSLVTLDSTPQVVASWGQPQTGYCNTDVGAGQLGYPESVSPQPDGSVLVGFGSADEIALLGSSGGPLWSVSAPQLFGGFVVDAVPAPGGLVIVTGFSSPGTIAAFNPSTGALAWSYHATAAPDALDDPRAAVPLPNGDVAVADTGHDRVVVIDPQTGHVVWQYGGSGVLSQPTGLAVDLWRDWRAK